MVNFVHHRTRTSHVDPLVADWLPFYDKSNVYIERLMRNEEVRLFEKKTPLYRVLLTLNPTPPSCPPSHPRDLRSLYQTLLHLLIPTTLPHPSSPLSHPAP